MTTAFRQIELEPEPRWKAATRAACQGAWYILSRGALIAAGAGAMWLGYAYGDDVGYVRGFTAGCAIGAPDDACLLAEALKRAHQRPPPMPTNQAIVEGEQKANSSPRLVPLEEQIAELCSELRAKEHGALLARLSGCYP